MKASNCERSDLTLNLLKIIALTKSRAAHTTKIKAETHKTARIINTGL